LKSRRLAYESGAIVALAERLATLLRQRDPVARRVELAKPAFLFVAARGVLRTFLDGGAREKAAA
ncbi:MAG TPA: hypothetical protein VEJ16_07245, partial [Alphaproteobacteria bacterium]|nr:hypothetical protein [Alphaproteobacteria bacterium]